MKKRFIYWLALGLVIMFGCQKELSFELGNTPSHGTLQSNITGDCLPKTVNGIYAAGTALIPATNTITVQINVIQTGTYIVNTDTVNGFYFRTTGTFTTLGANTVTLRSNGTPFAVGVTNFVVSYDSTICDIAVTVLPAGSGAAVFTLTGAPGSCSGAVIAGGYALGVPLNASNTVTLSVNVTTLGTFNITTTLNGMTFTKAGTFITMGVQTVVLVGSGTPTLAGANTIPITAGSSTCSFVITVNSAAVGTLGGGPSPGVCTPSTVYGTYSIGTVLNAGDTVHVQINVTTPGAYNISTNTLDGFSFSASGTAVTGVNTITLIGAGTPTTAGAQTFTVTFGASTCNFVVNVTGGAVGTLGGAGSACTPSTVYGSYTVGTSLNAGDTVHVQINVTSPGAYTITTNSPTGFSFSASGTAVLGVNTITLVGNGTPTTSGPQTITVTFGTSTCTFVVTVNAAPSNDYFPRTTNSNWSYETGDVSTDSLLRFVIPSTLTALGNIYNIFMQNDGTTPPPDSSGYYRKSGSNGDYFEYFDYGTFIGYDNPGWGEYIMLKDNDEPALTNWKTPAAGFSGTVGGTPYSIRFSYTILQKNVPITVITSTGTVNYQNVIVVEEKYELLVAGTWTDITSTVGYGKSYYAKGIGLILYESWDGTGAPQPHDELRRSQVF